ncbi:MAG: ABC transporter ATP-binding protein [Peptoniphilaceae bacterium]|nr:ABC transporter ATP-binding protein [Peptoniphilaceae bacterium]MDY6018873.1 ABC transporter ATP-binding protein [Anaerococcus sp.]
MILEVKNLNKSFAGKQILKNIDMNVSEKEIVSFVGPNGAGKSTTLKCITNFIFPDEGTITICGHDLVKERQKALNKIACQIESPGLFYNLSGNENIEFIKKIYKTPSQIENLAKDFIDIKDKLKNKVSTYSTGMKKRLAIGLAVMIYPKLLILDEPTNGLDYNSVIKLRKLLKSLKEEFDMSIIFSSHNLSV